MSLRHEHQVPTGIPNDSLEASKLSSSYVSGICSSLHSKGGAWAAVLILAVLLTALNYVQAWLRCYHAYKIEDGTQSPDGPERPPIRPSLVPFLGNVISFSWDNASFIRHATTYGGIPRSCRVSILPGFQIYLFQDRSIVKKIFKHPDVGSTIPLYLFCISRFFGMPERALQIYRVDNSGQGLKPHPRSNVAPDARPFHTTHKDLLEYLTGPGLPSITRRYIEGYERDVQCYGDGKLCKTSLRSAEWIQLPDLFHFTQHTVGRAMISAHFGPTLLSRHPGYMDDLWTFDSGIPWLARCVPRFLLPGPYRARDRMINSLMDWYAYARDHFDESAIDEDDDGDPVSGSGFSRRRQKTLRELREHDDRTIASLDVGHSWGSTANVTPTIFMATYYIFSSATLPGRLRRSLSTTLGTNRILSSHAQPRRISDLLDPKVLQSDALLCSIYAETMRLHGTSHLIFRASASADVRLNRWLLPRGSVGLVNAGILHMDSNFWNTRGGRHPVTEFWSDRFLVYPKDPDSGPVNPVCRGLPFSGPKNTSDDDGNDKPYFSMEETEGSWCPYGGGSGICVGRFLAKNAVLATLAYLVLEFDIEPQVQSMVVNPWRYGLGMNQPRYATPFSIRRRPLENR